MTIPFPVTVSAGTWFIEHPRGEIQIQFDADVWESTQFSEFIPLFYEGGAVLVHRELEGCHLSLNFGGGVPMDWELETETILLGDHEFSRTDFRNGQGELQFVIYDELFRVTFGDDVENCLQNIEDVLSSYLINL